MTLAYIVDGGLNDPPGNGSDLYTSFASVRRLYASVAEWTGVPVDRLLARELPPQQEYREAGAIRQAAVAFAICDLLAEKGIRPGFLGGLSLGGMIGASLAGSITRADLFGLLAHLRGAPEPTGRAQAVARGIVPADMDPEVALGGLPEGVHISADLGVTGTWGSRMLLLSGYRDSIDELAGRLPKGTVEVHEGVAIGYHSPLCAPVAAYLEPAVVDIEFRDPKLPLCSYLDEKTVTTADEVRDIFLRNQTEAVSLPYVVAELERHGTELALLIGPAQIDLFSGSAPFPVVQIETPQHLEEIFPYLHDLGINLPST
ncbi:ACP S-malonyltransferase [Streptomyces sp. NPDC003710]